MAKNEAIRTLEDIRGRCRIDADTGCWHWSMAISRSGVTGSLLPVCHVAPGVIGNDRWRTISVPKFAVMLSSRHSLTDGMVVWRRCRQEDCVNPQHCSVGTRAQWGEWVKKHGHFRGDPRRSAVNSIGAGKRPNSPTTPIEKIEQIKIALAQGMNQMQAARAVGVSHHIANRVALGKHASQRHAVAGASVFSWRP